MTTKLFSTAIQPINDSYEDFYSKTDDGENGACVTFMTISDRFGEIFRANYTEDEGIDMEQVMEKLPEIGVREDRPEEDFRGYTVILPHRHMIMADLDNWIEKLNEKFDEDFELWTQCLVCEEELLLSDRWTPDTPMAEHEEWKGGKPFCSGKCFRHYRGHSRMGKVTDRDMEGETISLGELQDRMKEESESEE